MGKDDKLVSMGVIVAPQGVRGQVRIKPFTAEMESLTSYGALIDKHGNEVPVRITGANPGKGLLYASIAGVNSREEAEKWRKRELFVRRSQLPKLEEGHYYHDDLLGLTVKSVDGKLVGKVLAIHNFGAGDIMEIAFKNGGSDYFPMDADTLHKVNIEKGLVVLSKREEMLVPQTDEAPDEEE